MYDSFGLFIAGRWTRSDARIQVISPVTGRLLGESPAASIADTKAALDAAQLGNTVAVLNLSADHPWWMDLARDYPDLWVFESLDDARGTPVALCVGRMDPASLAQGRVFSVTAGGDAGEGEGHRRALASHHGWTLAVAEGGAPNIDRAHGVIGRCG